MNNLVKEKCAICGSDAFDVSQVSRDALLPNGMPFAFSFESKRCSNCGVEMNAEQREEKAYVDAKEIAQKKALELICESLSRQGYSTASIERAFGLPQRTIGRWKSHGEASAAGMALMYLVGALPWLTKIADQRYERPYINQQIIYQAGNIILAQAAQNNYSAAIGLVGSPGGFQVVADFSKPQLGSPSALDSRTVMQASGSGVVKTAGDVIPITEKVYVKANG